MEKRSDYVLWFEECDLGSIPIVGGKNASLGELLKAEIPVPPGFAITTNAYRLFLEQGGIRKEIYKIHQYNPEGHHSPVYFQSAPGWLCLMFRRNPYHRL